MKGKLSQSFEHTSEVIRVFKGLPDGPDDKQRGEGKAGGSLEVW